MSLKRNWVHWLLVLMLTGLVACSTTEEFPEGQQQGENQPPPATQQSEGQGAQGNAANVQVGGASGSESYQGEELNNPDSPLSTRVFYFEFDSSELSDQALRVLKAHGKYLATHPERHVIVEGHTDERGSREYNLALGERRAEAVARVLKLNGAADDQLETVSYGEEKPAVDGHDEEAWAKNRRAKLVYKSQE